MNALASHALPGVAGAAVDRRARADGPVTLLVAAFYAGVAMVYWPIPALEPAAGVTVVTAALSCALVLAPLEFALGALAFAFLAAASVRLGPQFLAWRWVFLGAASLLFPLRFYLPRRGAGRPVLSRFGALLSAFSVLAAATVLTGASPPLSAVKLLALLCLFFVGAPAMGRLVERYGPAAPRRLIAGQLAFSGAMAAFPILGWALSIGQPTVSFGWFSGYHRNPNAWAMLAAALWPWLVCPLLRRGERWGVARCGLLAAVLLAGYTLLASGSRAGILASAVSLTIICLTHADRRIAALVALGAVLVAARSLADPDFLPNLVHRYVFKHPRGAADLWQSRKEPWKIVRKQFEQNRWMGLGFGVSSEFQSDWQPDVSSGGKALETGSSFWAALSQVGILGATPLFLAILDLLARGARFCRAVQDPWFTGIYASAAGLAVNSLFEGWLLSPGSHVATYFWLQCFCLNAMMCRYRAVPERLAQRAAEARGRALARMPS